MEKKINALSIVITVYNESDNIEPVLSEISSTFQDKITHEIILVDDGSNDDTVKNIQQMQKTLANIKLVRHIKNYGKSGALISGIRSAQYSWIATMDGDGQDDPQDILAFIAAVESSNATHTMLVAGHRINRQDNWLRRFSSRFANKIRTAFLNDDCPDTACGLKLFERDLFLELPVFKNMHRFLPALFKQFGASIINVPVHHRHRLHGVAKYGVRNRLWVGIGDLLGVAWLHARQCNPKTLDEN